MKKILWVLVSLLSIITAWSQTADFDGSGRVDFADFFIFADNFGSETTETPAIVDISDAIFTNLSAACGHYAGSYTSQVVDVQRGLSFAGDLIITVEDGKCIFETNAIPNHDFNDAGNFATQVSAQE